MRLYGWTAEEWFEHGLACDRQDRLEEAWQAFRNAVAARPDFAEARFNLGNLLRDAGLIDEAMAEFRRAAGLQPDLAEAWYNLADLLAEDGRHADAVVALERAVAADQAYADAHYNLAQCLEWCGRARDAQAHWQAYLRLDPVGPWAETARRRLSSP
ncbi:MAG: tetratricopeptide repeat protein [Actinomycetota bacterium]